MVASSRLTFMLLLVFFWPLSARAQAFAPQTGVLPTTAVEPSQSTSAEDIGDALMIHQRYQAAIAAYKTETHPTATLWNKLGIAYQMMFNTADALRCYQTSLRMDSRNTRVMNNLGTLYDSLKDYKAAEHMYRRALRINSESAVIQKNLGTNLLAQHKYQKGWEAYQVALHLDPDIFGHNSLLHIDNPASVQDRGAMNYYMAKGCARAGQTDQAIEYLRSALNEGFTTPKKVAADTEFASLHGVPAFEKLLASESAP